MCHFFILSKPLPRPAILEKHIEKDMPRIINRKDAKAQR